MAYAYITLYFHPFLASLHARCLVREKYGGKEKDKQNQKVKKNLVGYHKVAIENGLDSKL